jgi:Na+/H+-dicarboxylate symporter
MGSAMDATAAEASRPLYRRIPMGVYGLVALAVGLFLGTQYPEQVGFIGVGVKSAFRYLARAAPYIIFFTIFAAVSDMMGKGKAGALAFWVTMTFTSLGILGGIIGIFGAIPIFSLEFSRAGQEGAFFEMLASQVGNLLHSSQALIAVIYAAITAVLVGWGAKWKPTAWFCKPTQDVVRLVGVDGINLVGRALKTVFPFVLFAIGIFIPSAVGDAVALTEAGVGRAGGFETVFGTSPVSLYFLNVGIQVVLLAIYISIVVALVLWYTKFPVVPFFRDYFFLTYGFAWATSSSAASIPVTLERTGAGLKVRKEIRDFVVALGATMNLDGVMVASFTITVFASIIVGYYPTAMDLLLMLIPFKLVTMGVPGIPGGSAAVVPAVAIGLLPFTGEQALAFQAIWFAFAVGLSDQFRTGINTVTNGIVALLFESLYPKYFLKRGAGAPAPADGIDGDAVEA